jgi:acyl dehydratase
MSDTKQWPAAYSIDELEALIGSELGVSSYRDLAQADVDAFAEVTGDHQWIHTDPERAAATLFGGTIVHGYYTLSLAPVMLAEVLDLERFAMAVNYGLDKLRFPAPLPVGERVRMRVALEAVDPIPGGATLTLGLTFERPDGDKPVCVARALYRVLGERDD